MLAPAQNQAIFLGLVMSLTFLSLPARKGSKGVKWYDWLLVTLGVVPNAYILLFYDTWQLHGGTEPKTYELVFGIALAMALLEGLRRAMGIVLPLLTLAFMLHPIFSNHLPGLFSGRGYSVARVSGAIFFPPEGIYSTPLNIASTIVIGFLIFGSLLLVSAAGQSLTDLALSAVGRVRGGAAKAACIGSGLFGMLSGSPSANVAVTGTFTIPLMKRTGYSAMFAGGVEAAAANGGGLMPPVMGAVAFVMADMLEIPYIQVCYCAFVPALLYYFGMFMMVDRKQFDEIGGFDEKALYAEDYQLTRQIQRKRFRVIRGGIYSTNRRFKKMGHWTIVRFFLTTALHSRKPNCYRDRYYEAYWEAY